MNAMTGHLRKGTNRPIPSARAARRRAARAQARANAREYNTPVIGHVQRALIASANAGHMLAVDYLLGIGFGEAERYASAFGRKAAEVYREAHKADPPRGGRVVVRGRMFSTFRYADAGDLRDGALAYARTRHLVADTATARELVAA